MSVVKEQRASADLVADLKAVFAEVSKVMATVGTRMLRLGLELHAPLPVGDPEHPVAPYAICRLDGDPWPCKHHGRLAEQLAHTQEG